MTAVAATGAAAELLAADAATLWHPYASATAPPPCRLVRSAEGVRLRLAGVGDVVDGMSSWWAAIHGYRHPRLDAALAAQAASMSHVMFGGLTHAPAVGLARRLLELAGPGYSRVFLCDSGSVSVEVALKMCLQQQRGLGRSRRTRFLTVRGGYHGDTLGAMSLCDPVGGMHSLFTGALAGQVFAPRPPAPPAGLITPLITSPAGPPPVPVAGERVTGWAAEVDLLAERHADELAGVVVEPVLQGAGGMWVYDPACLRVLRELADRHGVPLVLDEIATGFGRTGTLFAAERAGVGADLVCVGKALTGGYLPMAAVLCTPEMAAAVSAEQAGGALMHGPTFMANPLACAVANANLDLIATGAGRRQVAGIEAALRAGLQELAGVGGVRDVRVLGAVGVVQTTRPVDVAAVTDAALARGVWLRPFRDLIYPMPPYVSSDADVAAITAAIRGAVHEAVS